MQATYALRKFSITPLIVALAVVVALILGGAGGYWLKSNATQAPATARIAVQAGPAQVTDPWESRLRTAGGELRDSHLTVSSQPVQDLHDSRLTVSSPARPARRDTAPLVRIHAE